MKEATGELNMTVVTVVAIAAIGALFTILLWPRIRLNIVGNSACSSVDAQGHYEETMDDGTTIDCDGWVCNVTLGSGQSKQNIQCNTNE